MKHSFYTHTFQPNDNPNDAFEALRPLHTEYLDPAYEDVSRLQRLYGKFFKDSHSFLFTPPFSENFGFEKDQPLIVNGVSLRPVTADDVPLFVPTSQPLLSDKDPASFIVAGVIERVRGVVQLNSSLRDMDVKQLSFSVADKILECLPGRMVHMGGRLSPEVTIRLQNMQPSLAA